MNDTLKVAGRIGAELGAAKAEVERLRGLLVAAWRLRPDQHYHEDHLQAEQKAWEVEVAEVLNAAGALPQQAEPTDTYTAVDMATAAAQGFRDGQAAVEQAPAQDERECMSDRAPRPGEVPYPPSKHHVAIHNSYGPMSLEPHEGEPVEHLYGLYELRDYGARCIAWDRANRPAQTEQQPVEVMRFQLKHPDTGDAHAVALTRQEVADGMEDTLYEKLGDLICHCEPVGETNVVDCNCDEYIYEFELVNAAPIAQTAQRGEA